MSLIHSMEVAFQVSEESDVLSTKADCTPAEEQALCQALSPAMAGRDKKSLKSTCPQDGYVVSNKQIGVKLKC